MENKFINRAKSLILSARNIIFIVRNNTKGMKSLRAVSCVLIILFNYGNNISFRKVFQISPLV